MTKFVRVCAFIAVFTCFSVGIAAAAEGAAAPAGGLDPLVKACIALAAGIGLGIAALGGAIGQGKAVASALDGIGRNPGASGKIMTPMIIGLAMIESLVIYSLVVSLLLFFKL
jgi:F-type H+-transporting ATPase subunit c